MNLNLLDAIPPGGWAVGVSGGADSVALLSLLRDRRELSLHVVHLDHQTRGKESTADAQFVADLSMKWNLPFTIARLDEIQLANPPANESAFYRAARFGLFRQAVAANQLNGVILAHHADDQAETVLQRLLRSSSYVGLAGMCPQTKIGELVILRPLLAVRRIELRNYLMQQNIAWREDVSNQSPKYLRNRLRIFLHDRPQLVESLLALSKACEDLRDWTRKNSPILPPKFFAAELSKLPEILAVESLRRWLIDAGVPVDQVDSAAIQRVLTMAHDAAFPSKQDLPGNLRIQRRAGMIFMEKRGRF